MDLHFPIDLRLLLEIPAMFQFEDILNHRVGDLGTLLLIINVCDLEQLWEGISNLGRKSGQTCWSHSNNKAFIIL